MRVRSSKMRVFSYDRYIFRMKFPTGFTYRNLHGVARFPGDNTARLLYETVRVYNKNRMLIITNNIEKSIR